MIDVGMKESEYFSLHKIAVFSQFGVSTMGSSASLNDFPSLGTFWGKCSQFLLISYFESEYSNVDAFIPICRIHQVLANILVNNISPSLLENTGCS